MQAHLSEKSLLTNSIVHKMEDIDIETLLVRVGEAIESYNSNNEETSYQDVDDCIEMEEKELPKSAEKLRILLKNSISYVPTMEASLDSPMFYDAKEYQDDHDKCSSSIDQGKISHVCTPIYVDHYLADEEKDARVEESTFQHDDSVFKIKEGSGSKIEQQCDYEDDIHEMGCGANGMISEAALQKTFSGLRGIECIDAEEEGQEHHIPVCQHLAIVRLRPDLSRGTIINTVKKMAENQGLLVIKAQGPHVVAELATARSQQQWEEWRRVDMQIVLERSSQDRVLLIRFLALLSGDSSSSATHLSPYWEVRRKRPMTRMFLKALKETVFEWKLNKNALSTVQECTALDRDYLNQLQDLARDGMNQSLEASARNLEEFVIAAEKKCSEFKLLLQPMYQFYHLEMPVLVEPLPLSYYPLRILDVSKADTAHFEEAQQGVEHLKAEAWRAFTRECDAEMAARIQRKNVQVLDRLSKIKEYQRDVLQGLRGSLQNVPARFLNSYQTQISSLISEIEAPIYYCKCLISPAKPGMLYLTYRRLIFVSQILGLGNWGKSFPFQAIQAMRLLPRGGMPMIELQLPGDTRLSFTSTTRPSRLMDLIQILRDIATEDEVALNTVHSE